MDISKVKLPEKGRLPDEILAEMKSFSQNDADYKSGKTWSLVYYLGDEHTEFLKDAFGMYFSENGLNPMAFKSLKRFESEIIRMTANMFHGDRNVVGTITSGGTESCLLAVKTYRDMAKAKRPWIRHPEMVVPETIHVAFEKAAEYFGVKAVHAPLGKDYRVDIKAVKKLINRNTILLIGSAPSYPNGMIDPIDELGRLAQKKKLPLHVDSCLGGFLLPFVEKLGYPIPMFDFRIPGVTSISADVHKYGYAAKGASTILYRNVDYLKHQMFIYENWPGGIFASPALLGTRPGGAIAAAWASMQKMGEDGYLESAKIIMDTTQKMQDCINAIPGLEVVAKPHMGVFAYKSNTKDVSIYAVGDVLEEKGWHVDRQQKPETLHAMVTPRHAEIADKYLDDLREAVEHVRGRQDLAMTGNAAMYGMVAHIPLRGMIRKELLKMMLEMYGPDMKMPDLKGAGGAEDLATKAGMMFLKFKDKIPGFRNK